MSAWQYLYTEDEVDGLVDLQNGQSDHQGIGLFARMAFADDDTNLAEFSTSVGLGGRGTIPGRDDDTFGIGYFYTKIQDTRIGGIIGLDDSSQGGEVFYNLTITTDSHLTFDIQILDSIAPAANTAFVLGTRLNLRF